MFYDFFHRFMYMVAICAYNRNSRMAKPQFLVSLAVMVK